MARSPGAKGRMNRATLASVLLAVIPALPSSWMMVIFLAASGLTLGLMFVVIFSSLASLAMAADAVGDCLDDWIQGRYEKRQ